MRNVTLGLAVLLITGCSLSSPSKTILEDSKCQPPCWQGITPGKTSLEETLYIVRNLPSVEKETIYVRGSEWNTFSDLVKFDLIRSYRSVEVQIFFFESRVSLILFMGDLGITMETAIREWGEPESVLTLIWDGYIPIFFDEKSGVVYGYEAGSLHGNERTLVSPNIELSEVSFFNPSDFPDLLGVGIFTGVTLNDHEIQERMHPWTGYGDIEEKYPP